MATRRVKHLNRPFELKSVNEKGVFSGYASVFGEMDGYNDIVMPGAFKKSIAARGVKRIAGLWQHDSDHPIFVHQVIEEDSKGLFIEGRLVLGVQKADEAYLLMQNDAVNGISIGYVPVETDYNAKTDVRKLIELDLWENSIVTFPALDSARVDEVKSSKELATMADCEVYLRDVGGFSLKEAKRVISAIKAAANPRDVDVSTAEIKHALQLLGVKTA